MKLKNVRISQFRSIRELRIDFNPSCLALIGVNESGKSNILRALRLLDSEAETGPADLRVPGHGEEPLSSGLVRFIFTPEKSDYEAIYKEMATRVVADSTATLVTRGGTDFTVRDLVHEIRELLADTKIPSGDHYRGIWSLDRKFQVPPNWVVAKKSWPKGSTVEDSSGVQRAVSSGSLIDSAEVSGYEPAWVEAATIESIGTALAAAARDHIENEIPEVVFWTYKDEHLLPAKLESERFAASPTTCIPLANMFELYGIRTADIGSSISAARQRPNGLRNLLDAVAERSTNHLKKVWKEYKHLEIELRENGSSIDCSVKDVFNAYNFDRRSDGFKRFIAFLFHVSAPARAPGRTAKLYLFDEPDLSLHPAGVQHLRRELLRIAEENTVVFSTHSIFMVDRERVDRHLIVEKNGEVTSAAPAEGAAIANEEVLYKALSWSLFEILQAKNVVLEGFGDRRMLEVYLASLAKSNATRVAFGKIGLVHAQGVKDVPRVTAFLDLAARQYVILTDSDAIAKEKQRNFRGTGNWYCASDLVPGTQAKTGEDFVKVDALIDAMRRVRKSNPVLAEPTEDLFPAAVGRVSVIENWVKAAGFVDKDLKQLVATVKDTAVEQLKAEHLEDEYAQVVDALKRKVDEIPD